MKIELYILLGKKVGSWSQNIGTNGKKEITIDLSDFPSGIYILQANDGEKTWRGKVIKE
jgi:hypothetical protein